MRRGWAGRPGQRRGHSGPRPRRPIHRASPTIEGGGEAMGNAPLPHPPPASAGSSPPRPRQSFRGWISGRRGDREPGCRRRGPRSQCSAALPGTPGPWPLEADGGAAPATEAESRGGPGGWGIPHAYPPQQPQPTPYLQTSKPSFLGSFPLCLARC